MSKGKIFLVEQDADEGITLEESGYITEAELQRYLERFPDLIPGDQINPEDPRRWLLVAREMGVPGDVGETGRWSLDHLFLDQDGIPTFVECKRASDTRARREVVAQMLDYAANGLEYWDLDRIRQSAAETAQKAGKLLDEEVLRVLAAEESDADAVEAFWASVGENLGESKVRLVFVSDLIAKELRRLVEFLNQEMESVEVLAVEVKQYKGLSDAQSRALVPRVIGMTEAARLGKRTSPMPRRHTTQSEFLEKCLPEVRAFFADVVTKAEERGFSIYWGTVGFSVRARLTEDGGLVSFVLCYPPDKFQYYFDGRAVIPRSEDSPMRRGLLDLGVFSETGAYTLTALATAENVDRLAQVYDQILDRIEAVEAQLAK
ncbi:MAG TPA: hypothetical protein VJP78_04525 [Thermoleophilia bacterium]|nr:hypothetical protein [Thermoleophilia bacterium]